MMCMSLPLTIAITLLASCLHYLVYRFWKWKTKQIIDEQKAEFRKDLDREMQAAYSRAFHEYQRVVSKALANN